MSEITFQVCPHRPGLAGVLGVRPASTLRIGEFRAMLPEGPSERAQLEPGGFDEDEPS